MMIEYYSFDMQELKEEVERILNAEAQKIGSDKDNKLKEISNNFKRIMSLASEHLSKGTGFKVNHLDEGALMDQFEANSSEYE